MANKMCRVHAGIEKTNSGTESTALANIFQTALTLNAVKVFNDFCFL